MLVAGTTKAVYATLMVACLLLASAASPGPCADEPEVTGVRLHSGARIEWDSEPGAVAYNIYFRGDASLPPGFQGWCLYSAFGETQTFVGGTPTSGWLWAFLVTAVWEAGEGSLGYGSNAMPRTPLAPCTCTLPPDDGPCDGICPRWFFNPASGSCEEFIWGCCDGNANNFEHQAYCEAECMDPCMMPAAFGDCQAAIPRWYYDSLSGQCELFSWGGCGGNANNFLTEDDCQAECLPFRYPPQ